MGSSCVNVKGKSGLVDGRSSGREGALQEGRELSGLVSCRGSRGKNGPSDRERERGFGGGRRCVTERMNNAARRRIVPRARNLRLPRSSRVGQAQEAGGRVDAAGGVTCGG